MDDSVASTYHLMLSRWTERLGRRCYHFIRLNRYINYNNRYQTFFQILFSQIIKLYKALAANVAGNILPHTQVGNRNAVLGLAKVIRWMSSVAG